MANAVEALVQEIERLQLMSSRDVAAMRARWFKPGRADMEDKAKFVAWLKTNSFVSDFALGFLENQQADLLAWNQYRIRDQVKSGPLAGAYVATDPLQKLVDIQVLGNETAQNPERLQSLQKVIDHAIRLDHPHVCRIREFSKAHDRYFVVREHYDAESLADVLKRRGRLATERAVRIFALASEGLRALHEHQLPGGALTPDCILLTAIGAGEKRQRSVRVLIANVRAGLFDSGAIQPRGKSTASYDIPRDLGLVAIPDEQSSQPVLRPEDDVLRLGRTFYRALTGMDPYPNLGVGDAPRHPARPLAELSPETPALLAQLVDDMIAVDPAARPKNAGHVAKALRIVLQSGEIEKGAHVEEKVIMPRSPAQLAAPADEEEGHIEDTESDDEEHHETRPKDAVGAAIAATGEFWQEFRPGPRELIYLAAGSLGTILLILMIELFSGLRFVHLVLLGTGAAISLFVERLMHWYEGRSSSRARA